MVMFHEGRHIINDVKKKNLTDSKREEVNGFIQLVHQKHLKTR